MQYVVGAIGTISQNCVAQCTAPLCRKPVVKSCTSLTVVERGPLRASLKVCCLYGYVCLYAWILQIIIDLSERSHLQQFIILDANCPYVKFETFVSAVSSAAWIMLFCCTHTCTCMHTYTSFDVLYM